MKVIGLTGYAGSGKDTLADLLVGTGKWKKVAFADALKDLFLLTGPCHPHGPRGMKRMDTRAELEYGKREHPVVRNRLQAFGQAIRDIDGAFWVKAARTVAQKHLDNGYNVVFSDVRYPNESSTVMSLRGSMVGIRRLGCGPVNTHPSEINTGNLLLQARWTIENDGDPKDMLSKLEELMGDPD